MKTILHAPIDGFDIVLGFSTPTIDPVATQNQVKAMVQTLPEFADIAALNQKINDRRDQAALEFFNLFGHSPQTLQSQVEATTWQAKLTAANVDVDALSSLMTPLTVSMTKKIQDLWAENAVYFQPGKNENISPDDQAGPLQALFNALAPRTCLALDGKVVPDNRGLRFWTFTGSTWGSSVVTRLGDVVPAGSVAEDALTADQEGQIGAQVEAVRIAGMSSEAKAAELAIVLDGLATQAQAQADRAKIMGTVFDPVAWYNDQKTAAVAKYS